MKHLDVERSLTQPLSLEEAVPQWGHPQAQALESKGTYYPAFPGLLREVSRKKSLLWPNELPPLPGLIHLPARRQAPAGVQKPCFVFGLFYSNLLFMAWDTGFPCKAMVSMKF